MRISRALCVLGMLGMTASRISAQEEQPKVDASALAKQSQNPVADLVTVPFQFNFNTGEGLGDGTLYNLNVQPVIPIKLNADWNLIYRTIVPFLSIPSADGGQEGGIGDIQAQLFLSPAHPGKLIWGVGPQFSFPTATNPLARTGSWAAGPTAVALMMPGHWVFGVLANQVWTFADNGGDPEVNQLLVQYFVNYNFGKGWAISSAPIITANWEAASGQEWTVPFGVGISKTTVFTRRPMTVGAQFYFNAVHPDNGPSNQFRMFVTLLFPTGRPGAK